MLLEVMKFLDMYVTHNKISNEYIQHKITSIDVLISQTIVIGLGHTTLAPNLQGLLTTHNKIHHIPQIHIA